MSTVALNDQAEIPAQPGIPVPHRARTTRARSASQLSGDETRARIIAAAIETLNSEGVVGASARTIARIGSFNQALIFYHFGSVEGLLIAAASAEGAARSARYATRFREVRTLAELITIAREVHHEEQALGSVNVLTQLLAGSSSAPGLREGLHQAMVPWLSLVEAAIARVLEGSALVDLVPLNDLAYAVSSLFLGIELMSAMDPNGERALSLLDSIERLSSLFEVVIASTKSPTTPAVSPV